MNQTINFRALPYIDARVANAQCTFYQTMRDSMLPDKTLSLTVETELNTRLGFALHNTNRSALEVGELQPNSPARNAGLYRGMNHPTYVHIYSTIYFQNIQNFTLQSSP